jgi:predicted ATP-grasp superfamily ATP-dependent carboligase
VEAVSRYVSRRPMPPAVVADVGWVNGLAAIRQLAHAGVPVVAVDHRAGALGFHSRHALGVRSPDPVKDPKGFLAFLAELGDALGRPAPIFPTHDDYVNAIAAGAAELGDRFLYPFPPWEVLEPIQSKRFQVEQAVRLGIPAPRTAYEPTGDLDFPVLVKPSDPVGFRRTFGLQSFRCETRAELDEAFERARPYDPLIQELIPGGDDELYSLGSYLTADGEFLGTFCGRKLRQTPPGVGSGRVCEAVWVDEVVEQGRAYLLGLGCYGLSQVEFKRDPRDGVYKLMEVNPRLWQWHGLSAACGVDFPRIAYWDLLGARLPPATTNGVRKRWAVTLLGGTRPAIPRPPYVEAVFSLSDPKPALAQVARIVRRRFR